MSRGQSRRQGHVQATPPGPPKEDGLGKSPSPIPGPLTRPQIPTRTPVQGVTTGWFVALLWMGAFLLLATIELVGMITRLFR